MENRFLIIIVLILVLGVIFFFPKTKRMSSKTIDYQEVAPRHFGFLKKEIYPDMVVYKCYGIFY